MTVRLAGLPLDLALWGVRQFAGMLGAVDRRLLPDDSDGEFGVSCMPVVFVHGLADRPSIFSKLQNGLRGCGAGPFVTATYSVLNPDIRVAARVLGEQVERVQEQNGGRPVCLIGHSMGGLIARYYVQRLGGDARVPLVITLATPHSGTAMALWAPPHPVLRQLRPGSPLLAELAEPCAGCRTQFVAFYSNLDEAIIPSSRARIDHPDLQVRHVLVDGVGHLMLPVHGTVIHGVRDVLTEAMELPLAG
ncbi:esterase/lipase family protein [Streptomyces xiangluensis]|uniref:Esterase/lipase family protein n=1 Tax=Streptomyces xiangluensis TaxID=2665720 RepID=A0ABV8YQN2_9ACTN